MTWLISEHLRNITAAVAELVGHRAY